MSNDLPNLFRSLSIGPVVISNRIASSAHVTNFCLDGFPTERHAYYLAEKAKGGIGLIIMEAMYVHSSSHARLTGIAGYDPAIVPALKKVVTMVHEQGSKIFVQLLHMGRQMSSLESRQPILAPSAIPCLSKKEIPHAMTEREIKEIIQAYGASARLAREAGFDGVEIHGAHGYLIQQFMSLHSNKRTDQWGGSLENRLRFAQAVIDQVREACGTEMAVGMRISGDEFTDGGLTLDDMQEISSFLASKGKLDFLNVSQCNYDGLSFATMIPDMHFPFGAFVYLSAGIKSVVTDIPVFTVGRIVDPTHAEQILKDHQADVVCMTRATLCDPEMPNKAKEGRLEEIRNCVGCNQGCVGMMHRGFAITCTQNPTVGLEAELGEGTLTPATKKKRVLIIGGGPAGMEAARIAALRGHRVTLWEKQTALGGNILLASAIPSRQELSGITRYLSQELERLGVEISDNTEATVDLIMKESPDAVIIATGSQPLRPDFAGAQQNVVVVEDVVIGKVSVGNRVVLLDDDGHYRATSVAEFLAEQDKEVHIVTPRTSEGSDIVQISWITQHSRLRSLGIKITTGSAVKETQGSTVIIEDLYSGEEEELVNIDTVVIAGMRTAQDELFVSLQKVFPEIYLIGDAEAPRSILEAIREGHLTARKL
ncbi:FAD-dependent oxidoreductase [Desulfosporosinus sp. BICA1-9]|uniref:oxidoreductase n=1 Tax=Desulfosporosinus sp. BICA1-9 TaxID=1531958 RepID=UPI00054B9686|nr:FAD-dependent oxidoreductase [Desulfosporosinus sp. BICA1-9]KJS46922.1 MAG: hypothetical protein VR66_22690 [Peptococcaceae bacterium BRH_c23]KJS87794.1 MAG: hypothetical protein JL57_13400 [Desulfosporosinus sp. BICA1-9]HBW38062.1 FAD-dependent oxidoreductase [Desulfosporosinus sp.]